MGCRVIFSCLKELARHLPKVNTEEPPTVRDRSAVVGKQDADEAEDEDNESDDSNDESERGSSEAPTPAITVTATASTTGVGAKAGTGSEAPKKKGLFGHAASLTTGVLSAGAKVGGAIVNPVVSRIRPNSGKGAAEASQTCPLAPHELKGLIGDVVLLSAPLNLRVSK